MTRKRARQPTVAKVKHAVHLVHFVLTSRDTVSLTKYAIRHCAHRLNCSCGTYIEITEGKLEQEKTANLRSAETLEIGAGTVLVRPTRDSTLFPLVNESGDLRSCFRKLCKNQLLTCNWQICSSTSEGFQASPFHLDGKIDLGRSNSITLCDNLFETLVGSDSVGDANRLRF